jgi:hypothetical protein
MLVTANALPSPLILFTLMLEAVCSSETSVLTTVTRRHIPEDGILNFLRFLLVRIKIGALVQNQRLGKTEENQVPENYNDINVTEIDISRFQCQCCRTRPHSPFNHLSFSQPFGLNYHKNGRRRVSPGRLRRVALVRTDVSEEFSSSFIRVTRICELGTTLALTSNRRTLRRNIKFLRSVRRLLVTASVVPCSPILVTLTKEAPSSS